MAPQSNINMNNILYNQLNINIEAEKHRQQDEYKD